MEEIIVFLTTLVSQYPIFASVLMVVGVLRLVNKPLFAILRSIVDFTPSTADNEMLNKVEQSQAYRYLCILLDYLGSVKLPVKKK